MVEFVCIKQFSPFLAGVAEQPAFAGEWRLASRRIDCM